MHPLFRPSILIPLALLASAPAAAQRTPFLAGAQLYGGLSLGPQLVPDELQAPCGSESFGAAEARAGVRSGVLALEVRGAAVTELSHVACLDFAPPPDGVHTERDHAFDRVDPTAAFDARLRFGGTRAVPVVASVGAGRLAGPGVSYVLASLGVRSRGRVRVALDVERDWYRVEYDDVTREYRGGIVVGEGSRERRSAWWDGTGVRLGAEMDLF